MQYFAQPTNARDASPEFAIRGLNYRKLTGLGSLPYSWVPTSGTYFYHGALDAMGPACASFITKQPVPYNIQQKIDTTNFARTLAKAADISLVTIHELPAEIIKKYSLERCPPIPTYPHVYKTVAPVTDVQIKAIVADIKAPNKLVSNVSARTGVPPLNGHAAIALANRCITGGFQYLSSSSSRNRDGVAKIVMHEAEVVVGTPGQDNTITGDVGEEKFTVSPERLKAYKLDAGHVIDVVTADSPRAFGFAPANIPEETQHIFAYFPGSVPNDVEIIMWVIRAHFSRILGPTDDIIHATLDKLEGGLKTATSHPNFGMLVHMAMTLKLAIEVGGIPIVLHEGAQFLGSSVITNRHLRYGDKVIKPVEEIHARAAVADMLTEIAAKDELAAIVSDLPFRTGGGTKVAISGASITTFEVLMERLAERIPAQESQFSSRALSAVSIVASLWADGIVPANTENITLAIKDISEKVLGKSGQLTTHLFTSADLVVASNLARFGPRSISFLNLSGMEKDLYQDIADDPNASKKFKVKKVTKMKAKGGVPKVEEVEVPFWSHLRVSRVPIEVAVEDWATMVKIKAIRQIESADGRMLAGVETHPLPEAKEMLDMLRRFGHASKKPSKSSGAGGPVVVGEEPEVDDVELDF